MGAVGGLAERVVLGAGMAGAGYLGLVTGKITIDLGVGRRTRPLDRTWSTSTPLAGRCSTSSPSLTSAGPPARFRTRSGFWNAERTWCWPRTSPRSEAAYQSWLGAALR